MALELISLFSLATALCGEAYAHPTTQNRSIHWRPCQQLGGVPVTCGTFTVPFDYTDPDCNKTLDLSLVKINAAKPPSKGRIVFNNGGPGEDVLSFVNGASGPLLVTTGGDYDLIGFNPRGLPDTLPFSCYKNEIDRAIATVKTPSFDQCLRYIAWYTLSEACYNNARETGEFIGTAFVARDMMQIVDALHEDGLLRYWGFSYGTILGMTVAAMFPDRMDRVVLDGVANPHQYYAGWDIEGLHDSDSTLSEFFKGCIAAPVGACALAHPNATASRLEQQFIDLLEDIKYNPIAASPAEAATIVDYGSIKAFVASQLYNPILWTNTSAALYGLLHRNTTMFITLNTGSSAATAANFAEANAGIRCGDNDIRARARSEVMPLVDEMYNSSFVAGDIQAGLPLGCATWKFPAKERYQGGFTDIKTKYPVMFVGNTYDPITPLVSAKNASAGFEGSVVLQHDGHGHSSIAQPSLCTAKAIRAYFVNGTLPEKGTKCEPSVKLFSNETIQEALEPTSNLTKRAFGGDQDEALLTAMKQLSGRAGKIAGF